MAHEVQGCDFLVGDGTGHAQVRFAAGSYAIQQDFHVRSFAGHGGSAAVHELLARHLTNLPGNHRLRIVEGVLAEGERVDVAGVGRWRSVAEDDFAGYRDAPRRLFLEAPAKGRILVSDQVEEER